MLEITNVRVEIPKRTPTIVGVPVVSKYDTVKSVTIIASCGCTVAESNYFVIEPFETKVINFTINRVTSGVLGISFVVKNEPNPFQTTIEAIIK
jgi:hypothetical protein